MFGHAYFLFRKIDAACPVHYLRLALLVLSMLAAGHVAAGDRVEMNIRLVLVDSCTIEAPNRARLDAIDVKCAPDAPHRVEYRPAREESPAGDGDRAGAERLEASAKRLTIAF